MLIKILVVEDSATDRLIIKSMLSEYQILTACDGQEALRMLQEHDGINLMILDLNMPRMNGFQVLESLKGDKRYGKLRTIVLTNYDEVDNEIKGLKLGAVDYIRKPIHMESPKARIDVHAALLRAEHGWSSSCMKVNANLFYYPSQVCVRCNYDRDWTMQYVSAGC